MNTLKVNDLANILEHVLHITGQDKDEDLLQKTLKYFRVLCYNHLNDNCEKIINVSDDDLKTKFFEIGEILKYNNDKLLVLEDEECSCAGCYFRENAPACENNCLAASRNDGKDVKFAKIITIENES